MEDEDWCACMVCSLIDVFKTKRYNNIRHLEELCQKCLVIAMQCKGSFEFCPELVDAFWDCNDHVPCNDVGLLVFCMASSSAFLEASKISQDAKLRSICEKAYSDLQPLNRKQKVNRHTVICNSGTPKKVRQ